MSSPKTSVRNRFVESEGRVFDRYGFAPLARFVSVGGTSVTVRLLETGSGEPVVLLHGLGLSSALWAPLIAQLDGKRFIAIDMPGHGGTDSVDFRHVDLRRWHTRVLTGVLDGLGLDSAHIVGHSYGGMFGLWLALDAPSRVRSVVALGAPSIALGARPDLLFRLLAAPAAGWAALRAPMPGPVHRVTLTRALGRTAVKATPRELWRSTYLATRRPGFATTTNRYLHEQFRGRRSGEYVLDDSELAAIDRPVLFIWGEHDDRYQFIPDARRKVERMPLSHFEVVPGGHAPWLDDPELCGRLLDGFLVSVVNAERRFEDLDDG